MGFQTCRDVTFSHTFPGDSFPVDLSLAHWKPRGKVARNPTVHYTELYFIISYSSLKTWNDDRTVAHNCHGETKKSQHHKLYSRQNKINSRQNKMYGGPQLSRHYKLYCFQFSHDQKFSRSRGLRPGHLAREFIFPRIRVNGSRDVFCYCSVWPRIPTETLNRVKGI